MTLKSALTPSGSGVQLASTMRPPGAVTRASSAAEAAWSTANMIPKVDATVS